MLRFILLYTLKVYQKIYVSIIFYLMDDVIPLCWHIIIMADVIAMWKMLNHIWIEVGVNLFVIDIGWCYCLIYFLFIGRCYCQCIVSDVKTTEAVVIAYCIPLLADVIAMHLWQMVLPPNAAWKDVIYGWCYCHIYVVDVITTEAAVIALLYIIYWLMLLPI